MICNYSLVCLVKISLIFCYYLAAASELKLFIDPDHAVYRCSTDEYLIIKNWTQFRSSKISCSNEPSLADRSLDIFQHTLSHKDCDPKTKSFWIDFYLTLVSPTLDKSSKNITDEQLKLLSSTIIFDNHTNQFTATRAKDPDRVLIYQIHLPWNAQRKHRWHLVFRDQPIACQFSVNYTAMIANEECVQAEIYYGFLCYYESSSVSPLQNVDWLLLKDLIYTRKYLPQTWYDKGAILYDARVHKTVITTVSRKDYQ